MPVLIKPNTITDIDPPLPSLDALTHIRQQLKPFIQDTPCCQMHIPNATQDLWAKMEIWQNAGSFKFRGALYSLMQLSDEERQRGVITASAGNHALALSLAAQQFNIPVKVLMPSSANAQRVALCQQAGAEVVFADSFHALFKLLEQTQQKEGQTIIHPYDGQHITAATASLGLEIAQQLPNLDALVVAIGGGGLISGVSYAMKLLQPTCTIIGVEPEGAATMQESFKQGKPIQLEQIHTIAQSLSVPEIKPYAYSVCSHYVDGIVSVSDREIVLAMQALFQHMKLAVEPAAAASLAAILGPLKKTLDNQTVGFILCGSNMGFDEFQPTMTQC